MQWRQLAILTAIVVIVLGASFAWATYRNRHTPPRPVLIPGAVIKPGRQ